MKKFVEYFWDFWNKIAKLWGDFLIIILQPWSLFLLSCVAYLIYDSLSISDRRIVAYLNFFLAVFSAMLGGIWLKKWDEINEAGKLVSKGKSAVRSLKLLLIYIGTVEARVKLFLERTEDNSTVEITKVNFEEIIQSCSTLQEHTLKSIEDWKDIIPAEADIETQIGIISNLKNSINDKEREITDLHMEIEKSTGKSQEEIAKLRKSLNDKHKELESVKDELAKKNFSFSSIPTTYLNTTSAIDIGDSLTWEKIRTGEHICDTSSSIWKNYHKKPDSPDKLC